jgi:NAD(P)H-hydrate epimerase
MDIPSLTTEQMREVDRLMIEVFNITLIQMMENAGRNLADLAQERTGYQNQAKFLILCGSGNNGGGGMVAARHLINRGLSVDLVLISNKESLKDVPRHQWSILEKMGHDSVSIPNPLDYDLIIDAMIGYGLKGNPRGSAAKWIEKINAATLPILSLDVPSGLDATLGIPQEPCTRAAATLTLALPKIGLLTPAAKDFVGDLYLADISVPQKLYERLDIDIGSIFLKSSIIKIV